MMWQALFNLSSGPVGEHASVFDAMTSEGEKGVCAIEVGAMSAVAHPKLAGVVVGAVYTACGCGKLWANSGSIKDGGKATELENAKHCLKKLFGLPRAFNSLLRLLLPPTHGDAERLESHADVAAWGSMLGVSILRCGLLEDAIICASQGVPATQLMFLSPAAPPPRVSHSYAVTGELTALLSAVEGGVEDCMGSDLNALWEGLIVSIPCFCELVKLCSKEALSTAAAILSSSAQRGSKSGEMEGGGSGAAASWELDTGPHTLLPKLHIGLCLRSAEAVSQLFAQALSAAHSRAEALSPASPECSTSIPLLSGVPSALLALLAAATPVLSASSIDDPAMGSNTPPQSQEKLHPHLSNSASLFAARLPPPLSPYLRPSLTRALANVMYGQGVEGEGARREALEVGGVPVVLAQTKMEEDAFLLREWALLAIKHWCEGGGAASQEAIVAVSGVREGLAPGAKEFPKMS